MTISYDEVNVKQLKIGLHKIVETSMTSALKTAISEIDSLFESLFQQKSAPLREMELQFKNKMCPTILTGEEIRGEGGAFLEVVLIDTCTGQVVDIGPQASASVEILVLRGEGFDEWFRGNIVQVELGKLPLLAGKVRVKLERGQGVLDGIKFRNHTVKMSPPVFRLGARVVDSFQGTQVKEAKTEVFTVKDFRNKYNRKHDVPSLSDKVWRLQNIQKGGKIDERLRKSNVFTVEDFLIQLLKNPQELKKNVNLGPKKWEMAVNHARTCSIDQRRYCYINLQQYTGVVFDLLGNVLGLILKGRYTCTDVLSRVDKAHSDELLSSACENWEDIESFDNEMELQEYLRFFKFRHPAGFPKTKHRTRSHLCNEPQPSETIGHQTQPSAEDVHTDDMEIEHGYPREATSSFAPVDRPDSSWPKETENSGPSGVVDECEIQHGHPPKATSSVAPVDHPNSFQPPQNQNSGPSGVTDECFNKGMEIGHGLPPEGIISVSPVDQPNYFRPQQHQNSGPPGVTDKHFDGGLEIEHGHPPEATSSATLVDHPDSSQPHQNPNLGPFGETDECFHGRVEIEHWQPLKAAISSVAPVDRPSSFQPQQNQNFFQPQQNQNSGHSGTTDERVHGGLEMEYMHPPEATSSVAPIDHLDYSRLQQGQDSGPSGVTDEFFYRELEELLPSIGHSSLKEFSYLQSVEDPLHNSPLLSPISDPRYM